MTGITARLVDVRWWSGLADG